jgi:UDP-glucose 4-epimerase
VPEAWVTGAKGFIGRYTARALAKGGYRVHGIGHGAWLDAERSTWGIGGWLNSSVTASGLDTLAAERGTPAVIVHLAGGSSVGASIAAPFEDFSRTVTATAELVEWVRTRAPATAIVAASSAAVYGDVSRERIDSTMPLVPCSPYGAHKAAMEHLLCSHARSFGLKVAILRLFSVYGPGLEKQLVWDLCTRLARGDAILTLGGDGGETRDFLYVEDAAAMMLAAVAQATPGGRVFNAGTGRGVAVRDLVASVLAAWAASPAVRFNGQSRAGDPYSLVADMAGAEAILPSNWTSLNVGMTKTVAAAQLRLRR